MDKTTLLDLKRLCDDYYTINEDVLTEDDVAHIHNLKTAIDKALTETELSTGDFAFWLNQREDIRRVWAISALDWEPATQVPPRMADLSVQNARRAHNQFA